MRRFVRLLSLAAVSLLAAAALSAAERNVVLYVVDDMGSTDAGCYGNEVIGTPGLDALARSGTRFTHAFCTTASCSASRSVILTGLYNHANGHYGHEHAYHHFSSFDGVKSLPVLLAAKDYRTARAGKFHVAPEKVFHFDQVIAAGASPAAMASNCRELIAADSDRPFFLYFCTSEPHRPFKREGSRAVKPDDVIVPPYLPDSPACREELSQYYGSVERADSGLDRLLGILQQANHAHDTLVIFITDNGIAFPGAKTTLYDPGMRLPCVVRDPYAAKHGVVCDAMITWADITPTILDFARATPQNAAFHGRSFLGVLADEHPQGWDEIYASHTFHEITMYYPMRVVRTRRHKLIWNIAHGLDYPFASDLYDSRTWQDTLRSKAEYYGKRRVENYLHRPRFELYDLEADPHEVNNLASDRSHAATLAELQTKLKAFQERTKDPWATKWRYE
ncbi:MAG: sulfatase [Burkholderiales bacterium]|nr:sulfatase [Burkholderiales bacterium]